MTYRPRPYAGRMLLIQSAQYAAKPAIAASWRALVQGVIEVEVIPDSTHPSLLLREDHTRLLADRLSAAILDALGIEE